MPLPDQHEYEVNLSWQKGRIGHLSSPDVQETIPVATPPQFPGGVEGIWSPEHLYTASILSCFFTSFTAIAEYSKLEFSDFQLKSSGTMSRNEDGKYVMSSVHLRPVLTIEDRDKEKKAYRIMEKAEQICLISRSVQTKIVFEPTVYISENVQ